MQDICSLVYTNDNCIGCNKCISACSCVGACQAVEGDLSINGSDPEFYGAGKI